MQQKPRRKRQRRKKPGYDAALKELLLAGHDALLALIAPGLTWIETLSEELPAGARRADLVWLVEDEEGRRGILHIELQVKLETEQDKDIRERMAEYALRLYRRDHLPVYSIVIFLKPVTTPEPFLAWQWRGHEQFHFDFEIIRLWEQNPAIVLNTNDYNLWPLAGLMGEQVTADTTFAVAEKIVHAPLERQEKSKLIGLLGLLVGMRLPKAELAQALERDHMIEEIWNESSYADAVRDHTAKITARRMTRVALERRFGALSEEVLAAIQAANEPTLEAVVGANTLEEARALLGLS
jgi:hypothetical protein